MHEWEAVLNFTARGLKDICPKGGWKRSFKLLLHCANCNSSQWEYISLGHWDRHRKVRVADRYMKCDSCQRDAQVFITKFSGVKTDEGISLMFLKANGLQPADNFIELERMLAMDDSGNVSAPFLMKALGGALEPMNLQFPAVVEYERIIKAVSLDFNRVRR